MCEEQQANVSQLYSPIKQWQTRILGLQPGQGNDALQANVLVGGLIHDEGVVFGMELDEPVSYEAISYSWGEGKATGDIIVNGLKWHMNHSLAGALRRFRCVDKHRYVWADAICINQADDAEKSVQVRNRFMICHKAKCVLGWLGDEEEGTAEALARFEVIDRDGGGSSDNDQKLSATDNSDWLSVPDDDSNDGGDSSNDGGGGDGGYGNIGANYHRFSFDSGFDDDHDSNDDNRGTF